MRITIPLWRCCVINFRVCSILPKVAWRVANLESARTFVEFLSCSWVVCLASWRREEIVSMIIIQTRVMTGSRFKIRLPFIARYFHFRGSGTRIDTNKKLMKILGEFLLREFFARVGCLTRSFIHSFVRSFFRSFVRSFVHSLTHPLTYAFWMCTQTQTYTHTQQLTVLPSVRAWRSEIEPARAH